MPRAFSLWEKIAGLLACSRCVQRACSIPITRPIRRQSSSIYLFILSYYFGGVAPTDTSMHSIEPCQGHRKAQRHRRARTRGLRLQNIFASLSGTECQQPGRHSSPCVPPAAHGCVLGSVAATQLTTHHGVGGRLVACPVRHGGFRHHADGRGGGDPVASRLGRASTRGGPASEPAVEVGLFRCRRAFDGKGGVWGKRRCIRRSSQACLGRRW